MATGDRTGHKKLHQSWRRSLPPLMGSGGEQAAQITARPSLGQVGQTSGRSDTVEDKLCPWISKLCHAQLSPPFCGLFSVFWFWAEAESFPKSPRWGVTPKTGLESYHPSTTPMDTKKNHLKKEKCRLFLWTCYQFSQLLRGMWKAAQKLPVVSLETAGGSSWDLSPCCKHSKARIPCLCVFLGNWRDNSPIWKPAAISGMQEKFSVEHQKGFFGV